jgi:hypothetical protein
MPYSGMWRRGDVWTDVSEERRFTQDLYGRRENLKSYKYDIIQLFEWRN